MNALWNAFGRKINLDPMPVAEFFAQSANSRDKSQIFKCGGMQPMGDSVNVCSNLAGRIEKFVELLFGTSWKIW